MRTFSALSIAVVALLSSSAAAAAGGAAPVFKIYVEHTGVYEISYEQLAEAGLESPAPTSALGLRNHGRPQPLWVDDGGDGVLSQGDRLRFYGHVLRGEYSYLDPYSRFNCYVLNFADPEPLLGTDRPSSPPAGGEPTPLVAFHHIEPDRVMVRFRPRGETPEEEWYWARLSVADRKPFRQTLEFDGMVRRYESLGSAASVADVLTSAVSTEDPDEMPEADRLHSRLEAVFGTPKEVSTVLLRFGLRGWSQPRHRERDALPHHRLDIELNGRSVGTVDWDSIDHYVHEIEVPTSQIVDGDNELVLNVPKRHYPESGDLVVDVVLLNWIEISYERTNVVSSDQLRLRPSDPDGDRIVELRDDRGEPIELYLPAGQRFRGVDGTIRVELPEGAEWFSVLRSGTAAAPDEIVLDRPSELSGSDIQADYIMITHRSLMDGASRLAEFHRSRGLTVEVIDVQDIYDEFNYGIVSPAAIRDFLQHAYRDWRPPAPRFVLLVGDASWDFKNTTADDSNYADWTYRPGENKKFTKNRSTAYAEGARLNHRNLVPTSSFLTTEGHAASDTWFVCFDDGDRLPDMAIGRIPVVSPEELDDVIDKTIAFAASPPLGPWKRNLLFIANESVGFQRRSDDIAAEYGRRGYVPTKIYPNPSEPANVHHTRKIIDSLDSGVYAVQFIGHGGRYIWRTGPPDLAKNHDLFTLEHLDQLAENRRLPVIMSLTCYSAPFDHPSADSIGEKFLRIPARGAVAVFAASWRNSPSPIMGEKLMAELTLPGNTIGEAVMNAKREFGSQVLVQTYNLLGDPAVPVAAAPENLGLDLGTIDGDTVLTVRSPEEIGSGEMVVDWVGGDGSTIRQDRLTVSGTEALLKLDEGELGADDTLSGARVYLWDAELGFDGIGWVGAAAPGDDEGSSAEETPTAPEESGGVESAGGGTRE